MKIGCGSFRKSPALTYLQFVCKPVTVLVLFIAQFH